MKGDHRGWFSDSATAQIHVVVVSPNQPIQQRRILQTNEHDRSQKPHNASVLTAVFNFLEISLTTLRQ